MRIDLDCSEFCLSESSPLKITDGADLQVRCVAGTIWITETGRPEDIFLKPGETHRIGSDQLTLVESVGQGRVCLEFAERTHPAQLWLKKTSGKPGLKSRLQKLLSRTSRAASASGFPA